MLLVFTKPTNWEEWLFFHSVGKEMILSKLFEEILHFSKPGLKIFPVQSSEFQF